MGNALVTARLVRVSHTGLSVRFYAGYDGLCAVRESWAAILGNIRRPRFFQEWEWYRAYLLHLEPEPERVCFALLTDSTTPRAIVPLQSMSVSYHGVTSKLWRLPEHAHMPLADVIAADGVTGRELVTALLAGMQSGRVRWDRVQFTGFDDGSCLKCPDIADGSPVYRDVMKTCEQLTCNLPWESFAKRLSANFRSNLNKARHKLERAGGATYEVTNDPARVRASYPEFLRVEASGWKGTAGTAVALDPRLIGFYQSLIDGFALSRRVYINVMRFKDRVVASQFCLSDSDTLYVLKQGYDESLAAFAPGNALLQQVIHWCFSHQTLRKINQVGSPHWFRDWKPECLSYVYRLHLFNRTALGRIHRFTYAARAHARAVRSSLQIAAAAGRVKAQQAHRPQFGSSAVRISSDPSEAAAKRFTSAGANRVSRSSD